MLVLIHGLLLYDRLQLKLICSVTLFLSSTYSINFIEGLLFCVDSLFEKLRS